MLMSQIFWGISGIISRFPWRQNKNQPAEGNHLLRHLALKISLWELVEKPPWISSLHTSVLPSSFNIKWFNERLRSVSSSKWKRCVSLHVCHSLFLLTSKVSLWRYESIVAVLDRRLFSKIFLTRFWLKFIWLLKYIYIYILYTHTLKHSSSLENSNSLGFKSFSLFFSPSSFPMMIPGRWCSGRTEEGENPWLWWCRAAP